VKYCDEHVCRSVKSHISETTWLNFSKFSVHVYSDPGSVILWQCWSILRNFGFVHDETLFFVTGPVVYHIYTVNQKTRH